MAQSAPPATVDKADFKRLWDNAFAVYQKEKGRKLVDHQELHNLRSVDDSISKIEAEGGSFTDWRNKHSKLWSRLSTCFKPVASIGDLAAKAL